MSTSHIVNILNKAFVREFYRMNSGFFLLFGTLAFGFMSEIEHRALAQFFVSSFSSLMIPVGVWILYTFKILRFNDHQLQAAQNRFLFNLQFLGLTERVFVSSLFFVLQFFPAIAYGTYLMLIAGSLSVPGRIMIILIGLAACSMSGIYIMIRSLQNPFREKKISWVRRFIDRHYVRPVIQFYSEGLLRKDPLMLGATKFLTGVLLFGVCVLYRREMYDWRLISMAVTACGLANLLLIFHLVKYEHIQTPWVKNLPITRTTRYVRLMAVMAIFLIPEVVVLLKNFPVHLGLVWMALNILYLLSLVAFFLGFLHTQAAPLEYFTRRTFWFFVVVIVMILFKVPLLILCILNVASGYYLFASNYYRYESRES